MKLTNLKIGLGITGSFCNYEKVFKIIDDLKKEKVANILPIISEMSCKNTTRFFEKDEFINRLKIGTENDVIDSIVKAEPLGPNNQIDLMLICPCTGNTVAKLANSITDSAVLMATKSHIRNNKPVVIGMTTNDGLGRNLINIGELINTKNYYFVPFGQDDYIKKPKSLALDYNKIIETCELALDGVQIQPILLK